MLWKFSKKTFKPLAFVLIFTLVTGVVYYYFGARQAGATVETFSTAVSTTWTAPAGVTSVQVECWGAGGGGAGDGSNDNLAPAGGGGGAYAIVTTVSVTPLSSYSYTVGTGGTGGSGGSGGDGAAGTDSSFNGTTCVAIGGAGGTGSGGGNGTGGDGGTSAASTGDTKYSGGNGAAGSGNVGGGSGSSAGTGSVGNNASGSTGGTAVTGGGPGANGPASGANGNTPGSGPGGGGSGSGDRDGGSETGGNGIDGQIRLTYTADLTPPTPNPYFTTTPAPDSVSQISMTSVTVTDPSTPVNYYFTLDNATCSGSDGGTGGTDSGWQSGTTYSNSGLQTNKCYGYTVTARDNAGNVSATSTASTTYTLAATPGGPTFSSIGVGSLTIFNTENGNPSSNPTTQFLVRASSSDPGWNNVYLTGAAGTSSSPVWLTDTQIDNLNLTGLQSGTLYEFEAVARNQNNIETATSTRTGTTTVADTFAPTPNPMTFASAPNDVSNSQIDMTSTVGSDDTGPISYLFTYTACASNPGTGGTTSSWQTSTTYSDTGLAVNKCYGYTVTARDSLSNTGSASASSEAYTAANTPSAPTLGSVGATTFNVTVNANSNPSNTEYAVRLVNPSPADATWSGQYVNGSGNPSATAVWMTKATIDAITVSGLNELTSYDVEVKARNGNNEETSFSTAANTTTSDATPPTPSPMTFSSAPNDNGTTQIDMTATTASDPSGPVSYLFTATAGSCGGNLGTGGTTSSWQTSTAYSDTGLQINKCYAYTVQARDALLNTGTVSSVSQAYTAAAVPGVPTGNTITDTTFRITNNENSNPATTEFTIRFASSSPSDGTWNGQYLDTDGTPSATPVWMTDATIEAITVTDLNFITTYSLESTARNGNNEATSASTQGDIATLSDQNPPTPNPTFSSAPSNDNTTQISMISNTVTDPSTPVEYYFTAVTGSCGANIGTGGTDSGWQTSTSYTDSGLQANRCYGYTVTARDSATNTTSASTASVTYTSANTPGLVTASGLSDVTITINIDENSNPTANPNTQFAVFVTSADGTWNNRYVDASGNPNASAQWLTNAQIDGLIVSGLSFSTTYTFSAKARNADNDETGFGSTNGISTVSEIIPKNRINGGVRLQGTRLY